jgi:hypothetical protein
MLAVLPENNPFFGQSPCLPFAVNYHDDNEESLYELPTNNPADNSDSEDDGSAFTDDNGDDIICSDDDTEYEDDNEAADNEDDADEDSEGDDDQRHDSVVDNDDAPSYSHSIEDVPALHRTLIEEALHLDWDIDSPRDFQVVSINQGTFNDNTVMYLISKTGSGKSAVPLTIATLRCGITIVLVPLLGLGSDQVKKASREERGISAYHVDEHRGADGVILREWLLNMTDDE